MKRILKYAFVLTAMAAFCAGLLAETYKYTKPYIDEIARKLEQNARREVVGEGFIFKENKKKTVGNYEFIPAYKDEELRAYVVKAISNKGYGGDIVFSLGIDLEGDITGLKVIESKETPGLGAKIHGEINHNGKKIPWGDIWIGRDKAYEFDKSIDAFAGATVSPKAVYSEIKKILKAYEKVEHEKSERHDGKVGARAAHDDTEYDQVSSPTAIDIDKKEAEDGE